jgi:phosphatidate cytidylyltransferase
VLAARIATAVIGVPLVLMAVWLGGVPFAVLGAITAGLAAREAFALVGLSSRSLPAALTMAGAVGLVVGSAIGPTALIGALALVLAAILFGMLQPGQTGHPQLGKWSLGFTACLYAGLPVALLVLMRGWPGPGFRIEFLNLAASMQSGAAWVFAPITTTWAVDTIAYAVGRSLGRRPFSPRLSPRKTWEGTAAGFVAGSLVFVAWAPALHLWWLLALIIGAVASCGAIAGDLVESAIKRAARAKDAGQLLPGHGGLLDRLDSLAISTIVVFLSGVLAAAGGPPR